MNPNTDSRWCDDLINRLLRYPDAVARRIRVLRLRSLGVQIGNRCWIQKIAIPRNPWDIAIDDYVSLDYGVILLTTGERAPHRRLRIGSSTYVNRYTMFDVSQSIQVGEHCMIGPFCYITDHDHSTAHADLVSRRPLISEPVRVGNNVWIGAGAIVLKGVTVGDNALIAAGAVVTRSVPAGGKVAGVPAREFRTGMRCPINGGSN